MRVYIAGPMSGLPDFNYPAFNAAADLLRTHGVGVLNPADIEFSNRSGRPQAWDWYMRRAIQMVSKADGIALLPGWEASKGANLEHDIAKALKMDIRNLDRWLS